MKDFDAMPIGIDGQPILVFAPIACFMFEPCKLHGPGSLTCDRVGAVTIEDCKICHGTGTCSYGKQAKDKTKD